MSDPVTNAHFQRALDTIADAWTSGDLSRFMALHVDAPDIHYVSGHTVVEGRAAIGAMYAARFGEGGGPGAMGHLSLKLRGVRRIGDDHGFVIAEFTLTRDGEAAEHCGITTMLLRHDDEAWKVLEDHSG